MKQLQKRFWNWFTSLPPFWRALSLFCGTFFVLYDTFFVLDERLKMAFDGIALALLLCAVFIVVGHSTGKKEETSK